MTHGDDQDWRRFQELRQAQKDAESRGEPIEVYISVEPAFAPGEREVLGSYVPPSSVPGMYVERGVFRADLYPTARSRRLAAYTPGDSANIVTVLTIYKVLGECDR